MNNDRETENDEKTVPTPRSDERTASVPKNLVTSIRDIIDSIKKREDT